MAWMALAVLPVAIGTLYGQVLRALKRVWASMMVSAVWIPALAIVGLWFLGSRGGPVVAIQVYDVAAVLTALGAWAWWRRITPELRGVRGDFDRATLLRSSVPLLWVASMTMAMNWIATFALGAWSTVADVGVFNAASRVSFLVAAVICLLVSAALVPRTAALGAALAVAAALVARNVYEVLMVRRYLGIGALLFSPSAR